MNEIHINVDEIPEWKRDRLAAATLDFILTIMKTPGGLEALKAGTAARKKEAKNVTKA